jgi:uncharacterized protein YbjT (DUF2867 family)
MILVTGASGSLGRLVLQQVRGSGTPYRTLYRSEAEAGKASPADSAVVGDFADKAGLARVLAGVDMVYLVCSPIPALAELEGKVIQACVETGVRFVLLNSALGAGDYPKSFPSWHRQAEEKLEASGLSFAIVRPNGFMQNILTYMAPSIRSEGAFYAAMGDARTSFLDTRDIAAAIGKILKSPDQHLGKTYELNGPEAVSYSELANRISKVAGSQVRYVDISEDSQRKSMLALGMPEWQVDALIDLQRYYVGGKGGEVTEVLPRLLGRPPINLDQFLQEFADNFQSTSRAR